MTHIRDVAGRLNPARKGRRLMAMLWFYCDESYDQSVAFPKTFCIAGFVAEEKTWRKIERTWDHRNKLSGVERFHAAPLNARDGEYKGWGRNRRDRYAKKMLRVLKERGPLLHAVSFGMYATDYEDVINGHGRKKFGDPYMVCFKMCIVQIAMQMQQLDQEWKCSFIIERNPRERDAIEMFYRVKDAGWEFSHRLGTCTPGGWEEFTALQPADLIAYESMKLLQARKSNKEIRESLQGMFAKNSFQGYFFDRQAFLGIKESVEKTKCENNCWFPIFRQFDPDYKDGDPWE